MYIQAAYKHVSYKKKAHHSLLSLREKNLMIERGGSNQFNSVSQTLTRRSDWMKG